MRGHFRIHQCMFGAPQRHRLRHQNAPGIGQGDQDAALVVGAWPKSTKVIDLALHKTLDAAGERHVRVVDADQNLSALFARLRASDRAHCDILFCDQPAPSKARPAAPPAIADGPG